MQHTQLPPPCQPLDREVIARFWPKVLIRQEHECWTWTAASVPNSHGMLYGLFWANGKNTLAHRFTYDHFVRPLQRGEIVRHKCDNTLCVNPAHLQTGNHQDNMDDMVRRKRSTYGERNHTAVLTHEKVGEARRRVRRGETIKSVSLDLGVVYRTLHNAVSGSTWKYHEEPPVTRVG